MTRPVVRVGIVLVEFDLRAPHIVERHVGEFRHLHHRREGMQVPQRHVVVAIARQRIEIGAPELEVPDRGDVLLRGVAHVRVARVAQVERDVELGAAHAHVGIAIGVDDALDAVRADLFGEFEAAVHGAGRVLARQIVEMPARSSPGCLVAVTNPSDSIAIQSMAFELDRRGHQMKACRLAGIESSPARADSVVRRQRDRALDRIACGCSGRLRFGDGEGRRI